MPNLTVLTAGSLGFHKFIGNTITNAERFGYQAVWRDLSDFPKREVRVENVGLIIDTLIRCEGPIAWIDGDAVLHRPIDGVLTDDYDVGVTQKRGKNEDSRSSRVASGVTFWNYTPEAILFAQEWYSRAQDTQIKDRVRRNQPALRVMLEEYVDLKGESPDLWSKQVREVAGARVKFFPYTYNFLFRKDEPSIPEDAKIIHFPSPNLRSERYVQYRRMIGV